MSVVATPTPPWSASLTKMYYPFATEQKHMWSTLGYFSRHCLLDFVVTEQELSEKVKSDGFWVRDSNRNIARIDEWRVTIYQEG
jgi:hypothetical protein